MPRLGIPDSFIHRAAWFLAPQVRRRLEGALVTLALILFAVHLGLFAANRIWDLNLESSLFNSALQALYTPFSVILIAEVYLLVYYLPTSFARSLGKQIEIVALIEIRSVFKSLDEMSKWPWDATFFPHLLAAVALGGILVLFYSLLPRRLARIEEVELNQFVRIKTLIAGLLSMLLLIISIYAFAAWGLDLVLHPSHLHSDPNSIFYNTFFTVLILVDVLLLVVSFRYLDDFGLILRNSGFIVSTILLRQALGSEPWHGLAYDITAGLLAVLMILTQRGLNIRPQERLPR
ncbi:MAG: hypothetical protein ACPGYK_00975 [Flavobacteriales bacterium]